MPLRLSTWRDALKLPCEALSMSDLVDWSSAVCHGRMHPWDVTEWGESRSDCSRADVPAFGEHTTTYHHGNPKWHVALLGLVTTLSRTFVDAFSHLKQICTALDNPFPKIFINRHVTRCVPCSIILGAALRIPCGTISIPLSPPTLAPLCVFWPTHHRKSVRAEKRESSS